MVLKCKDCGNDFDITDNEQKWYKEMGYEMPKRCKPCRDTRKIAKEENRHGETKK